MAKCIANVTVGNIEERQMDFGGVTFDYIIFGDVLEHLRDPEGTLTIVKIFEKRGKYPGIDSEYYACIGSKRSAQW